MENLSFTRLTKKEKKEPERLVRFTDDFFDSQLDISRRILEKIWFRNILYYMGEQWLSWAANDNSFKRIATSVSMPTPVTNIIRDFTRSMKALILNKDFETTVWPNSDEQEDKEAAKTGEIFLNYLDTKNDEEFIDEKEKCAIWMILTGTSFIRTFPKVSINRGMGFDEDGVLIKKGEIIDETIPPFNIAVSSLGDKIQSKKYIGIKSLKDREWVEDTFNVLLPSDDDTFAINYQKKLMKFVGNVSAWKGAKLENLSALDDESSVLFKEIEYAPTKDFPNGRYSATCCGKKIFDYEKMPIPVDGEKWNYSVTDFHYHYVPGRYWSDSSVNDLISPQNTINRIDQALETNRDGLGRPVVMLGSEMGLKKLSQAGQSFLLLKYDGLLSGGLKPEIHNGTPLPVQVLNERNVHVAAGQDAAGDPKNILRGRAPGSQSSGVMVDSLRAAAELGHFPDITRFYRSIKRINKKRLILAQYVYTEKQMIKIGGKGSDVKVKAFIGADLRGNTDVQLEISSGIAATETGRTQMLMKLIESGFFSEETSLDPAFRIDLLQRMGLSTFSKEISPDIERALSENAKIAGAGIDDFQLVEEDTMMGAVKVFTLPGIFLTMQTANDAEPMVLGEDPLFKYDDHGSHYETHRLFLLSPEFKSLSMPAQTVLIHHTDIHKSIFDMQQQEQQQAAIMQEKEKKGLTNETI